MRVGGRRKEMKEKEEGRVVLCLTLGVYLIFSSYILLSLNRVQGYILYIIFISAVSSVLQIHLKHI